MGMFDYLKAKVKGCPETLFQTKDFDCQMACHEIRSDGSLWYDNGHTVSVPKEERPYPDAPDGSMLSFAGCMKWVPNLEHRVHFTGSVNFYTGEGESPRDWIWHEFTAVYVDGNLVALRDKDGALRELEAAS